MNIIQKTKIIHLLYNRIEHKATNKNILKRFPKTQQIIIKIDNCIHFLRHRNFDQLILGLNDRVSKIKHNEYKIILK